MNEKFNPKSAVFRDRGPAKLIASPILYYKIGALDREKYRSQINEKLNSAVKLPLESLGFDESIRKIYISKLF